jgi:toxin CcdB
VAQFDVFTNPGRQRTVVPFVVALQNARYDRATTRFVAALVLQAAIRIEAHWLAPRFFIAGQDVVLDVFNLATVPVSRLGAPVASLADEESRIKLVRALDEFLSQA